MTVYQNNVTGVENNYWQKRQFFCKISPDEIFGISAYMAEKAQSILANLQLIFGH